MAKYVKAKAGPKNSVIYTDSDGQTWAFEGRNRPWRNQNPGDVVPGVSLRTRKNMDLEDFGLMEEQMQVEG